MDEFINFIKEYISLSEKAEADIRNIAVVNEYNKGDFLIEEGKTCNHLHFLSKGVARTFFYQKGKDITNWVYPSNSVFTSWYSYLSRLPSPEYIEITDDSKVVSLQYDDCQDLYKKHPELERFGRFIVEEQIALVDGFYKGYYFLSAKEKYELLVSNFPSITQIANLGHIASMLGISQETLSRIRGK